jgi:hypothetical protein
MQRTSYMYLTFRSKLPIDCIRAICLVVHWSSRNRGETWRVILPASIKQYFLPKPRLKRQAYSVLHQFVVFRLTVSATYHWPSLWHVQFYRSLSIGTNHGLFSMVGSWTLLVRTTLYNVGVPGTFFQYQVPFVKTGSGFGHMSAPITFPAFVWHVFTIVSMTRTGDSCGTPYTSCR